MTNKIWIGFGIFGMICLAVLLIFFGLALISVGGARKAYTPEIALKTTGLLPEIQLGEKEKEISEQPSPETLSRLVIRTGTMNMVVKDIKDSINKIIKYAQDKGGWVVNSSLTEVETVPSGFVTIRVPSENFDEALTYFRGLAIRVTYEGTQGQDVTEEYVDLESRLRNLEATEAQLLKIMERSGKISEVLDVQRELTKVREDIEKTKGRMQYLERSVKMATITVNLALSEELLPIPPAEKWRPKYVLLQAWKSVLGFWRGFSYFAIKVIVWAVVWVPFGIVIWYGRKIWKKRKEARK